MRLLVIDNSAVSFVDGKYYTNSLNGLFFDELISLGNKVLYFQFVSNTPHSNINSYDLIEHGVECKTVNRKRNKFFSYLNAFVAAFKLFKKVDFVYFFYPNTFRFCILFCGVLGKPYGLYVRGMNGIKDKISRFFYKKAYAIFTVSDYFTTMVNDYSHRKIAVTIRPMISYTNSDIVYDRTYQVPTSFKILFLGRIDKEKGLCELLKAAKILHEKGFVFHLEIIGDGSYMQNLISIKKELNILDYVSFGGPVYDEVEKAKLYRDSDLYILPTYHEGFPRTLYESMIFGTPIVTTIVGGISALMVDGENCKRIEPRSEESIVEGLSYAMNYYEEMGRMARNASRDVSRIVDKNRLTHAQSLNKMLRCYGK